MVVHEDNNNLHSFSTPGVSFTPTSSTTADTSVVAPAFSYSQPAPYATPMSAGAPSYVIVGHAAPSKANSRKLIAASVASLVVVCAVASWIFGTYLSDQRVSNPEDILVWTIAGLALSYVPPAALAMLFPTARLAKVAYCTVSVVHVLLSLVAFSLWIVTIISNVDYLAYAFFFPVVLMGHMTFLILATRRAAAATAEDYPPSPAILSGTVQPSDSRTRTTALLTVFVAAVVFSLNYMIFYSFDHRNVINYPMHLAFFICLTALGVALVIFTLPLLVWPRSCLAQGLFACTALAHVFFSGYWAAVLALPCVLLPIFIWFPLMHIASVAALWRAFFVLCEFRDYINLGLEASIGVGAVVPMQVFGQPPNALSQV